MKGILSLLNGRKGSITILGLVALGIAEWGLPTDLPQHYVYAGAAIIGLTIVTTAVEDVARVVWGKENPEEAK